MKENFGQTQDNSFGVLEFLHWNHGWNSYKYSDDASIAKSVGLMKECGVKWVRLDFLWEDIEPKQGEFSFEKYDRIVKIVSLGGLKILGVLHYSANWASESNVWNSPPKDNKLFVNYTEKVISRFKDKIKYWEIWNEPDSPAYWVPQDGLKRYCLLLRDVYVAAKNIDPECKVLNGGLVDSSC